jgi:methionyl-tRNA formyltransferase
MNDIKIILLCSSRFALPALKELAFFRMLAVIAIPRHCEEMVENVTVVLTGCSIPLIQLDKEIFADQIREAIEKYQVTMGLVMTFSYKIPSSVYNLAPKGFYNVHPGPLPQYRGADPIFHQLKNKEKHAGVTIHKLDEKIDTGPVVLCELLKIEPADTYGFLTTKLANLAARLTGTLIKLVSFEVTVPSKSQDETKARYFKKQQAKDITIDWQTMDADSIIALMNACNPWNKGAVTKMNNHVIRLLEAEKFQGDSSPYQGPGYIIELQEKGMIVSTIHDEAIIVRIVYTEEGFLGAPHLGKLGMIPGNLFGLI